MADQALARSNVTALATEESGMFSDARLQMIRNMVAKGAPEHIFAAMIDIAKTRRLDPLAKQIICVQFKSNWTYIVTIDGYRSIAEQTGVYAGSDAPTFTWYLDPQYTSLKKLIPQSATLTVYKLINGERYPFSATVFWEEYNGGINNWLSMPCTMLAKVAETHALRKAFPAVLGGMPTDEEPGDNFITAEGRVVNQSTGEFRPQPEQPAAASRTATTQQSAPRQIAPKDDPKAKLVTRLAEFGERLGISPEAVELAAAEYAKKPGTPVNELVIADLSSALNAMTAAVRENHDEFVSLANDLLRQYAPSGDVIDADSSLADDEMPAEASVETRAATQPVVSVGQPMTAKQNGLIQVLARDLQLSSEDLDELVHSVANTELVGLSRREASNVIEELQARGSRA